MTKPKTLISDQIVLGALNLFKDGNSLANKDYLCRLFDLINLIEKLVIHEKIYVRDEPGLTTNPNYEWDINGKRIGGDLIFKENELLENLIKKDPVLQSLSNELDKSFEIIRPKSVDNYLDILYDDYDSMWFKPWFKDCDNNTIHRLRQFQYAIRYDFSFIADNHRETIEAFNILSYANNTVIDKLIKQYNDLDKYLNKEIQKLSIYGRPTTIYIPPITAIIFERAESIEDLIPLALEARQEFMDLRVAFRKYEDKIMDDTITLKESLNSLFELKSTVSTLYPENDKSMITQINEWRDLADLTKILDGVSTGDASSISKLLLGQPIKLLSDKIRKRKIGYLFKIKSDFLNIKNYSKLSLKLFKKEITSKHIEYAIEKGYGSKIV